VKLYAEHRVVPVLYGHNFAVSGKAGNFQGIRNSGGVRGKGMVTGALNNRGKS
jgi:hypothetical protein